MPWQNRVTPGGELVTTEARGTLWGNRGGCLHDDEGRIVRSFATRAWIACRLDFRGRRRTPVMPPGRFTGLFFLDEATALAAGHRPCFECRRDDAVAFTTALAHARDLTGRLRAADVDAELHRVRLPLGAGRPTWTAELGELPDGTIVRRGGVDLLVVGGALRRWSFEGYGPTKSADPHTRLEVLTPELTVAALQHGYRVSVLGASRTV